MVTVQMTEALVRYTDGKKTHQLEASTIGEALRALVDRFPGLSGRLLDDNGQVFTYLVFFHNDERVPRQEVLDRPLTDSDRVEIIGAIAGG